MLTRNYYIGQACNAIRPNTVPASMSFRTSNGAYTTDANINYKALFLIPSSITLEPPGSYYYDTNATHLMFGNSEADENIDDYTIQKILTNISSTAGAISTPVYDAVKNTVTVSRRFVILNNGETATITEFGLFSSCCIAWPSLIYRKKLDEPFTINSGETVNFDISVEYQMPVEFTPYIPG